MQLIDPMSTHVDVGLFDSFQSAAFTLMKDWCYPAFLKTPFYEKVTGLLLAWLARCCSSSSC